MIGATDTHIHFYDDRFPPAPGAVLHPPNAGIADYRSVQRSLGLERVVVVQPTTYGVDNRCQLAAVADLGDCARAVVVVDSSTPTAALGRLTELGVRGARFHMLPGGAVGWDQLEATAAAIAAHGWHIQLQLDGNDLPDLVDRLLALPTDLVIDHVGRFMPPRGLASPGFRALCRLIDSERCHVKLSAPYEGSCLPPPHDDVAILIDELIRVAPERLLWASNWPHPGQDDPPTIADLDDWRTAWIPAELQSMILIDNPGSVYGFPPVEDT